MSLFRQKGSPYWHVEVTVNGKRVRRSTKTANRRKAQKIHDALVGKLHLENIGLSPRDGLPIFFKTFAKEYLDDYAKSKRSYKSDVYRMKHHVTPFFEGKLLQEITKADVSRFRSWLSTRESQGTRSKGKTLSPATQNRVLALLRKTLSFARRCCTALCKSLTSMCRS